MFGSKKPAPEAAQSAAPSPEAPSSEGAAPAEAAEAPAEAAAQAPEAAPAGREAELEAEVARLKDQLLRTLAESENARRRAEREMEDARKFAVSSFARELLPVADNLRRAVEAVPADQRESSPALKALIVGVEATERQLNAAFEKGGIKPIVPLDQPFDPNFHQVMFEVESADKAPGTIVQVLQNGYTIAERLLRPALVGTAKAPASGQVDTSA